jgi:hypothetical protein
MSIKVKISIAVASVIAIGILPFTGGFWGGLWNEMSKPSKYICVKSHNEQAYVYSPGIDPMTGNMKSTWHWETRSVCDKEILNPERIKWDEEHK